MHRSGGKERHQNTEEKYTIGKKVASNCTSWSRGTPTEGGFDSGAEDS